jgi:hypothetical protein
VHLVYDLRTGHQRNDTKDDGFEPLCFEKRGFDCDDYMDGWTCLSEEGLYMIGTHLATTDAFYSGGVGLGLLSFVQCDRSDAWTGDDRHHRCRSLAFHLECLNDTLKLTTWLRTSFCLCFSLMP